MKTYNTDGLKLIQSIESNSIDLILTDPPYILSLSGGGKTELSASMRKVKTKIGYISNDFNYKGFFPEFIRVCKTVNILIFCSNKQIARTMSYFEKLQLSTTLLTWNKTNAIPNGNKTYKSNAEFIVYIRGKNAPFNNIEQNSKIFEYPFPMDRARIHPTEKPIPLLERLIARHSNKGDIVLDPFGGGFTTAIACHNQGRHCITSEIDTQMYDKATKRLQFNLLQTKLF